MSQSDLAKERAARLLKKQGSVSSIGLSATKQHFAQNKTTARSKSRSISSVSHAEEPDSYRPAVKYENTYQTAPSSKLPVGQVRQILKDVLESYLAEERYESELCREMSKTISEVVRNRIKELRIKRYKVIATITIGMLNEQGISIASRCLWDQQCDNSVSYEFRNNSLFAIATIFGVYQE